MQHTVIIDLPKKPPHVLLARLAGKSPDEFLEYIRAEVLKSRGKEDCHAVRIKSTSQRISPRA